MFQNELEVIAVQKGRTQERCGVPGEEEPRPEVGAQGRSSTC